MRRTPVHRRRRDDTLPGPALAEERSRPRSPTRSIATGRPSPTSIPASSGKGQAPETFTGNAHRAHLEQLGRTLRASDP